MYNRSKVIKLFSDCITTKGYKRSIICDLGREYYKYIPNILQEILTIHKNKTIGSIEDVYGRENSVFIEEYIHFLIENDFAFLCDENEVDLYPDMDLSFEEPCLISNAILDFDKDSAYNYRKIFEELSALNCEFIQIRVFNEIDRHTLSKILEATIEKSFYSIQIILKYSSALTFDYLISLFNSYTVESILVHSVDVEMIDELRNHQHDNFKIYYDTQLIRDETHCGIIDPYYFVTNIKHFTESINYNTCLNKKISIDKNGMIKNCPSCTSTYGHINKTALLDVIDIPSFKMLWSISKDKINTCQDCEFRHICTDCRAYIKDFDKPLKCGYNPYEAKWESN